MSASTAVQVLLGSFGTESNTSSELENEMKKLKDSDFIIFQLIKCQLGIQ